MTKKREVLLGYRVGSGEPVSIPIRHMCVAGQTQEAGKTTALEGLISRSGLCAVTFITKRGEGSFRHARRIDPFFREQADWQFVASVLEASRSEKLKFERAWIIRASKGARTLADVQTNVRRAMKTAKGLSADVYLTLDAYLDAVVPTISRVQWAKSVDLNEGVNVMDLTYVPPEMQHLVIKSTIDWILEYTEDTIVVVPEAWKFIPQGRGTPVKLSAEAFIRQAAGLKNYLWLDSQDIGGIEKTILRSVPVWVLGVQREANEIKRTLENLPASTPQLKAADIASLELGEFYACWQKHAIKTYAQPAWCTNAAAQSVAKGLISVHDVRDVRLEKTMEDGVDKQTARRLTDDNQRLLRENETLHAKVGELSKQVGQLLSSAESSVNTTKPIDVSIETRKGRIIKAHVNNVPELPPIPENIADIYGQVKARLLQELPSEPTLLRVLVTQSELEIQTIRTVVEVDGSSPKGRIARLLADGFFDTGRTQGAVRSELKRTSGDMNPGSISRTVKELVTEGFLTAEAGNLYLATSAAKSRVRVQEVA